MKNNTIHLIYSPKNQTLMRKITSFLALVLMFVCTLEISAYKVVYSSSDPEAGAFYRQAPDVPGGWAQVTSGFTKRWVSYGTPRVIISMAYNNMNAADFSFWSGSSKSDYTVTMDDINYVITKLTIRWKNRNTDGSHDQTIIMADGNEATAVGTGDAEVSSDFTAEPVRTTSFGMGSSANTGAMILAFELEYIDNPTYGFDLLQDVLQRYAFDAANFPIGDEPGFFPEDKVGNVESLYFDATDASGDTGLSDDELRDIAERYAAAYEELLASQHPVILTAGNYYMVNAREGLTNASIDDFLKKDQFTAAYCDAENMRVAAEFDPVEGENANPLYMWALESATDSTFYLKSIPFNKYVQSVTSNGAALKMTDDETKRAEFLVRTSQDEPGFVYLRNKAVTGLGAMTDAAYVISYGDGYAYNYNNSLGTYPMAWKFIAVNDTTINNPVVQGKIQAFLDSVAQAKLYAELKTLYNKAVDAREAGRSFIFSGKNNGQFPVGEGLVTDAEQVFSNAKETREGTYEGLFDGVFDGSSFFHTAWGTAAYGNVTEPHYLQLDLTKPVETLILKYAVRSNAGTPDVPYNVTVYGTNNADLLSHATADVDTVLVPTSAGWDSLLNLNFTYDYQILNEDSATVGIAMSSTSPVMKGAGIAKIEMPAAYQYVRLSVNTNVQQEKSKNYTARKLDGYTYWNLSELRAYEGQYDPDCVYAHMDEAARTDLETSLANALEEIKAGKATQEVFDALQKAYDAYMAVYPDEDKLKEEISFCQSFVDAAVEGEDPGYFEANAKADFQTVINNVKSVLGTTLTFKVYNDAMTALKNAYKAFSAKLILPADGTYLIMSMSGATKDPDAEDGAENKRPESSPYGSYVYAQSSSTRMDNNAGLRWGYADDTDPDYRTNAQWVLTKLEDGSGFTLKNLFNGLYMSNKQRKLSNYIHTSETPDTIRLRYARYEGGFNLVLDEDETYFVNASPSASHNGSTVAWNNAKGDDNSVFVFIPTDYQAMVKFSVDGTKPTIFTMPFDVECDAAYGVKGKKVTAEAATVELEALTGKIEAGTPFIVYPNDETVTEVEIEISESDANNLTYLFDGKNTVKGLVGVIQPDTIDATYAVWGVDSVTAATRTAYQIIAANSGYFNIEEMPTTEEAGVASLPLSMRTVMGIETVAVEPTVLGRKAGVFTIQGVRLNNEKNLPKGVYIINGKKVVKK